MSMCTFLHTTFWDVTALPKCGCVVSERVPLFGCVVSTDLGSAPLVVFWFCTSFSVFLVKMWDRVFGNVLAW